MDPVGPGPGPVGPVGPIGPAGPVGPVGPVAHKTLLPPHMLPQLEGA